MLGQREVVRLQAGAFDDACTGVAVLPGGGDGEGRGIDPLIGAFVADQQWSAQVIGTAGSGWRASDHRTVGSGLQADHSAELPSAKGLANNGPLVPECRQLPHEGTGEGMSPIKTERSVVEVAVGPVLDVVALAAGIA